MALDIHADDTALVPASLAHARAALAAHPLAVSSTALALFEAQAVPYADQMAKTGLGFTSADGQRRLWTVSKRPLYSADGMVWPGAWGTTRDDTGAPLGVVGSRYRPLQNHQLADALEAAFSHLPARVRPQIVNAGALGAGPGMGAGDEESQGARVYAQLALPEEFSSLLKVDADKDSQTKAFLTLTNTNDGTTKAVVGASATRIVCRNTWQMAHADSKVGGLVLRHTVGNVAAYREHVSRWYREIAQSYKAQGEKMRVYSARTLSAAVVDDAVSEILFGEVLPADGFTRQKREKVAAIIEMIEGRDGEFVSEGDVSAYSVLQAVTAYEMHRTPVRGELAAQSETRLWRVLQKNKTIPRAFAVLDRTL